MCIRDSAGLTNISKITSSKIVDGKKVPCDGQLWYLSLIHI